MTQEQERKYRSVRSRLWSLQILIVILLIGMSMLFFRFSSKKAFKDAIKGKSYDQSAVLVNQMEKDIRNVFSYANLAARFETAGKLDLDKVLLSGKDSDGKSVSYTLQDAIDYGESLGAYFDADNRLVLRQNEAVNKGKTAELKADNKSLAEQDKKSGLTTISRHLSEDSYANWTGNFIPVYPDSEDKDESGETVIYRENSLLTLLNQLAEYYDLQSYLGIDETDSNAVHNLHFRLIMSYGDQVVLTANDSVLTRTSLNSYGRYLAMSSEDKAIASNLPSAYSQEMVSNLRGSRQLTEVSYNLLVAVNTTFDNDDIYRTEARNYRAVYLMIWTALGGIALLLLILLLTIRALANQDSREILEEGGACRSRIMDHCCAELLLLFLLISGAMVYWSAGEMNYAVLEHSWMDLLTGIVIMTAAYFPLVWTALCVSRRRKMQTLLKTSFLIQFYTNIRSSLNQVGSRWHYGRAVHILVFFHLSGTALAIAACQLWSRSIRGAVICLALLLLIWIIAFRWIEKRNRQRSLIFERIQRMVEGEIGQELDAESFDGDMKKLAETVNDLDRGLENAVRERTHEERVKTDLIANVSHDLRTPLTSIITYVELIRREKIDNPRVEEYLNILDQKAMRLKTMAEELMDAGRAASGNLKINWMRIDLVEMIYQLQGEFADRMESRKLICVLNNLDPPAFIAADGKILWRVLDNLYTNVCKYAMPGTVVQVDLKETMGSYIFTMKNISQQTLDMSADELEERFVQGDKSRNAEGSGLGLSIAKSMTEQLHGKFDLFPEGDVFRVRLVFPKLGADEEAGKKLKL